MQGRSLGWCRSGFALVGVLALSLTLVASLEEFVRGDPSLQAGAAQPDALVVSQASSCAGENLLANGDAESGPIVMSGSGTDAPSGWQQTGGLRALAYGVGTFPL